MEILELSSEKNGVYTLCTERIMQKRECGTYVSYTNKHQQGKAG